MTTQELVTFIASKTNETRPIIVSLLNEIQKFIYKRPMEQTTYRDAGNFGLFPFMATTSGVYRYTFPAGTYPVEVLRTHAILGLTNTASYGNNRVGGRLPTIEVDGNSWLAYPIHQKDKTVSNSAEIMFDNFDPGTSTTSFYHYFSISPTEISSENIEFSLPEGCHLAIATGVISLLKAETYGDESAFEYWKNKIASEIWYEMNQGAQNRPKEVRAQLKDRNYSLGSYNRTRTR